MAIDLCSILAYRMAGFPRVPGHQLGGRRRFKMSEVTAYLESDEMQKRVEELKEMRREGGR